MTRTLTNEYCQCIQIGSQTCKIKFHLKQKFAVTTTLTNEYCQCIQIDSQTCKIKLRNFILLFLDILELLRKVPKGDGIDLPGTDRVKVKFCLLFMHATCQLSHRDPTNTSY